MTHTFLSQAPAKIILSGEHAVVYGAPALATAVSCFAKTSIQASTGPNLALNLLNLRHTVSATLGSLRRLRRTLLENYKRLLVGQVRIRDVLKRPTDLFQYAFISLIDAFEVELEEGAWVSLQSNIPIGCGMGSSAAVLVSFLKAASTYLRLDVSVEWLARLAREVEHLQHGRSSGLDTHLSLFGGSVLFQEGNARPVALGQGELLLVNTGKPSSTTGECVLSVQQQYAKSTIWNEFAEITRKIEQACLSKVGLDQLIKANQWLLEKIGVVPNRVQTFIREIEALGGAAKICGAGAIRGHNAGMVAIFGCVPSDELLHRYGFSSFSVQIGQDGATVV